MKGEIAQPDPRREQDGSKVSNELPLSPAAENGTVPSRPKPGSSSPVAHTREPAADGGTALGRFLAGEFTLRRPQASRETRPQSEDATGASGLSDGVRLEPVAGYGGRRVFRVHFDETDEKVTGAATQDSGKHGIVGTTGTGKSPGLREAIEGILRKEPQRGVYERFGFGVTDSEMSVTSPQLPAYPNMQDIIEAVRAASGTGAIGLPRERERVRERPILDTHRLEEDAHFRGRIAALNGMDPDTISDVDLLDIRDWRVNGRFYPIPEPHDLVERYIGNPSKTEKGERFQELAQLTEAYLDLPTFYYSYGVHSPAYTGALMLQEGAVTEHKALLVGALTQSTINEFSATVRLAHPDAKCLVTDIEGAATTQVDPDKAKFLFGDARVLPVATGSVDSIHTNILLNNLEGYRYSSAPWDRFFGEAHRALSQTGQLIMVERSDFASGIQQRLEAAGFTDIVMIPAMKFTTRRSLERALTFGRFDPPELTTEMSEKEILVIATKQPAGTTKAKFNGHSSNL